MTEALRKDYPGAASLLPRPTLHREQVIVHAVLRTQPLPLAGMLAEHGALGLELAYDIHVKVCHYRPAFPVYAADRVHEVEMRNSGQGRRGRWRNVIGRGRGKAGVPRQRAGRFVIAHVIHGRGRQHDVRPHVAHEAGDAPAARVVVKNGQIAELGAAIDGPNAPRGGRRFRPSDSGDLFRPAIARAAVSRRQAHDGYAVPLFRHLRQCACCQNLHVVRMRVYG